MHIAKNKVYLPNNLPVEVLIPKAVAWQELRDCGEKRSQKRVYLDRYNQLVLEHNLKHATTLKPLTGANMSYWLKKDCAKQLRRPLFVEIFLLARAMDLDSLPEIQRAYLDWCEGEFGDMSEKVGALC